MLEFKNVYKSYDNEVLRNLSFLLAEGERIAILGESGIGKTTVFNLILDIEKPDSGEISNRFNRISTVFQEDRLIDEISALDNLHLVSEKKDESLVEILNNLGIYDVDQVISEMSGGMKRRVSIARALAYGGDLFLLDEPIQGLDEDNRDNAIDMILRYVDNSALILITHDPGDLIDFKIENVIRL